MERPALVGNRVCSVSGNLGVKIEVKRGNCGIDIGIGSCRMEVVSLSWASSIAGT